VATEVIMPQMGFDMTEGTLVRWIKAEGDAVDKGEPIAEVETDKAVVEIEAYATGLLKKTYVGEGITVPVGHVIGVIAEADEEVPQEPPSGPVAAVAVPATTEPVEATPEEAKPEPVPPDETPAEPTAVPPGGTSRIKASPLARKEAAARGVDLAAVTGTGPGGRVTRGDVLKATERSPETDAAGAEAAAEPTEDTKPVEPSLQPVEALPSSGQVPLTRMRQAIARSMARSKREIPHFYLTVAIDMTEALKVRKQANAALEGDPRISINDLVVKACAGALLKHPMLNASFADTSVQVHNRINIGIAIALENGLIAPCIFDADQKGIADIAKASASLAERARSGGLTADEMSAATFNITNLGMYGIESFSAVITPPQAAALAVGSVVREATFREDQVVAADMMRLTLSIDHRVADGAQGANFMADIRTNLENPISLFL